MRDHLFFEQLHRQFAGEINLVHNELESISTLFKNMPLSESHKKQFLESSFKSKAAYYACLVNSNIDVLLIPEYLESKLSRNILIKKETDQYFQSVENFRLHTIQTQASIYDCILYNESAVQQNSFDLFSNQAPESANCPEDLKLIFDQWQNDFEGYSALETLLYGLLDWHAYNQFSFSNKRQTVLFINYQLWKLYGNVFQKINVEAYLFENWKSEKFEPINAIKGLIQFIQSEILNFQIELKASYRNQINFKRLNPKQKIVSNFVFEKGFKLNFRLDNGSFISNSVIKQIQKKGFVTYSELNQLEDIQQQKKSITVLLESGILELCKVENEVGLYLNTSFINRKQHLYQFQNVAKLESKLKMDEFFNQSIFNPIVPIEKLMEEVPAPKVEVAAKRQKAFFG